MTATERERARKASEDLRQGVVLIGKAFEPAVNNATNAMRQFCKALEALPDEIRTKLAKAEFYSR